MMDVRHDPLPGPGAVMAYSCRESLEVQTYNWELGVWVAAERLGGAAVGNVIALDLKGPLNEVMERLAAVKLLGPGHLVIPWERFKDKRDHGVRVGLLWSQEGSLGNFPQGWPPWVAVTG